MRLWRSDRERRVSGTCSFRVPDLKAAPIIMFPGNVEDSVRILTPFFRVVSCSLACETSFSIVGISIEVLGSCLGVEGFLISLCSSAIFFINYLFDSETWVILFRFLGDKCRFNLNYLY